MSMETILARLDFAGFRLFSELLSVLWQSTILLLAAGALAHFLRHRSAAARHAVWSAAVLAIPLLPLLSPGAAWLGSPRTELAVIPSYEMVHVSTVPAPSVTSALHLSASDPSAPVSAMPSTASKPASPAHAPIRSVWDYPWALGVSGYLLAVSALLIWMFAGRLRIRRWILGGAPLLDTRTLGAFALAGKRLGLAREIPVLEHPGVPAPLTCGILRPVVILPSGFAENLADSELRAVALHELAHVRRRDTLAFGLVALVRAVFFFQPLLWPAARRISYLAELACDRAALGDGDDPAAYAELLTRIACCLPDHAISTEMAAGILLSKSAFFRRVREILSDRNGNVRKLSRWVMAGAAIFGAASLIVALAFPLGCPDETGNTPPGGENALKKKNWLEGTVVGPDGQPVTGARFTIQWFVPGDLHSKYVTAKTDRRGRFHLEGIPMKMVLMASLGHRSHGPYSFPYTETNRAHTFVLRKPDGFVAGRVIDESGKPVKGAEVSTDPNIGPSGFVHSPIKTAGNGTFRLENLENEPHVIRAGHRERGQGIARDVPDKTDGITIVLYRSDFLEHIYTPFERDVLDYQKRHREMGTAARGKPAPEIEASSWVNGSPETLAGLRGKIVVLFFWNSGNWDSIRPLVLLDYWKRNYGDKGVEFIALHPYATNIDTVRKLAVERSGAVPVAIDRKSPVPEAQGETFDRYGVIIDSYPKILVIDREGKIVLRGPSGSFGGYFDPCEIEDAIKRLLNEKA